MASAPSAALNMSVLCSQFGMAFVGGVGNVALGSYARTVKPSSHKRLVTLTPGECRVSSVCALKASPHTGDDDVVAFAKVTAQYFRRFLKLRTD